MNGKRALLISVEMQEGNNIVRFGEDVRNKLDDIGRRLPSVVKLTTIVNQPAMISASPEYLMRPYIPA